MTTISSCMYQMNTFSNLVRVNQLITEIVNICCCNSVSYGWHRLQNLKTTFLKKFLSWKQFPVKYISPIIIHHLATQSPTAINHNDEIPKLFKT